MRYCNRPFQFMWVTMTFDGEEKSLNLPCAWLNIADAPDTDLTRYSVEEVWGSQTFQKVRESVRDGSFRYCNHGTCPYLANGTLPELAGEEFQKAVSEDKYPTEFDLAYDRTCNHACPSCRSEVYRQSPQQRENIRLIGEKLLPYLDRASYISSNGQGDFFASKENMELFHHLHPGNPEAKIAIETNGVLFNEKNWSKIEHLAGYRLSVVVTPNSFERDTYAYLCGGFDNLDKLKESLGFIRSLRREGKISEFKLVIVIQDTNVKEAPEFIRTCLEEYEADQVITRPIYKWNFLSEEDYWFKNVSNPLHPYHLYYERLMESEVMRDPRVYHWDGTNKAEGRRHPAYRYEETAQMLNTLIQTENIGRRLKDCFASYGEKRLIFYGDSILGQAVLTLMRREGVKVAFVLTRDKLRHYEAEESDLVVVTNYQYFYAVKRDLDFMGFPGTLLNLGEVLHRIV